MIYCSYCGQLNDHARSFECIGCGASLPRPADYAPPRPIYSPPVQPAYIVPIVPVVPYVAQNFRCPFCQTTYPPLLRQRISAGGWIVFVALLLFCFPFCFIGLLIKESYRVCAGCGLNLGSY
jgi:LITAF-like zinc ribbon domain